MLTALAMSACDEAAAPNEASPRFSRVEAVQAQKPLPRAADFCDVSYKAATAPALELPPHQVVAAATPSAGTSAPASASGFTPARGSWVWLNFWATWCTPCVREMPLIQSFSQHLRDEGVPLETWFASLDDSEATVSGFWRAHAELATPRSLRLLDADALEGWLVRLGLKAGTSIPVNVLLSPDSRVRCVRAGAIADGDYAAVRAVLHELMQQ